jgi:nitroreductase
METLKAILSRRSIRKYFDRPVTDEMIRLLLKAGMYAPSARNKQPWHFIVVRDRKMLDRLAVAHPYGGMLLEAPLAVVVCGDRTIERMDSYLVVNCSAATQNILLAAYDMGLGSVWLGIYPREDRIRTLARILNIPEDILPVSLIAIGYPAEEKGDPERFLPERIHYDLW